MEPENVFLSELTWFRPLHRFACSASAVSETFFVTLLAAVIVVALASMGGIACCQLPITPSPAVCFGYMAEANHGPAYLFVVPIFAATALALVHEAHDVITELASGGRLRLVRRNDQGDAIRVSEVTVSEVTENIRICNDRAFRLLLPAALIVGLVLTVMEILSMHEPEPGWIQAPLLKTVVATAPDSDPRIKTGSQKFVSDTSTRPSALYYVALASALTLEGLFYAFATWVVFKIGFIMFLLYGGYSGAGRVDSPDKQDEPYLDLLLNPSDAYNFRFGLKPLDRIYDRVAVLTLLGAVLVVLQYLSNVSKGIWHPSEGLFFGQTLDVLWSLLVLGLLWVFPGLIFGQLTNRRRHMAMLEVAQQESTATPDETDRLEKLKSVIHAQRAWPAGDKKFLGLSVVIVAIVLLVLGVDVEDKPTKAVTQLAKIVPLLFCRCDAAEKEISRKDGVMK